jgi:type IV secretory pathway VirB10-like protein
MSDDLDVSNEDDSGFETTPEEATSLDGKLSPNVLNRKKLLITICASLALVVCGGLIINTISPSRKNTNMTDLEYAARQSSQNEFLSSLQNRAIHNRRISEQDRPEIHIIEEQESVEEPLLPVTSFNTNQIQTAPPAHFTPPPAQQQQFQQHSSQPSQQQRPTHYSSSLVPQIQGSLFSHNVQPQAHAVSAQALPDFSANPASRNLMAGSPVGSFGSPSTEFALQNNQQDKQAFFDSSSGGVILGGQFLGDNSLWIGTIIPGVLETAINTDLPGNVLARVTQNIFDSRTGQRLLIPQGTILVARYNSSVSYAQSRVQIVWDTLIRPDGYQIDLDGANSVDRTGMSGQAAIYHENWFEYIKAAGIISLFSIANARMVETAAQGSNGDLAANVATANAGLVNQLSGNMISRAMNIQPRLTVENGTRINIMLNKTIYLPPVERFPVNQRFVLE